MATLNPVQYLDWPSELDRVLQSGVKALRFFPDQQGWPVESEAFQAIIRRAWNVPLLLPVSSFGDATRVGAVMSRSTIPWLSCPIAPRVA